MSQYGDIPRTFRVSDRKQGIFVTVNLILDIYVLSIVLHNTSPFGPINPVRPQDVGIQQHVKVSNIVDDIY